VNLDRLADTNDIKLQGFDKIYRGGIPLSLIGQRRQRRKTSYTNKKTGTLKSCRLNLKLLRSGHSAEVALLFNRGTVVAYCIGENDLVDLMFQPLFIVCGDLRAAIPDVKRVALVFSHEDQCKFMFHRRSYEALLKHLSLSEVEFHFAVPERYGAIKMAVMCQVHWYGFVVIFSQGTAAKQRFFRI
jgi:hypothetical protein